jgi:DNA-binding MarR family transcriptional regulator
MRHLSESLRMTPAAIKSLFHLSEEDPTPMRDLAEHWGCDASYVTSVVDMLEERGMAERQQSAHDRRVKTVALTELGVKAKAEVLDVLWEPPRAFDALTPAEQRQLRDLLRKVARADEQLRAEGSGEWVPAGGQQAGRPKAARRSVRPRAGRAARDRNEASRPGAGP